MPIYEYACDKCAHEFEVEQRITDEPVKTCPKCRSRRVKKLISLTSFVLKGDGWYSDLYSSSTGKKKDDEPKSDGGGGAKKEAASEKPDAGDAKKPKSEPKPGGSGKKSSSKAAA